MSGGSELGVAEGEVITLNLPQKIQITLKSATSFLPAGVTAKVYAIYAPGKKSKGFHSVGTFDSNNEESIRDALK